MDVDALGKGDHPVSDTTSATLNPDDLTRALVRRNLLRNDKYVPGIEAGTEVFKGSGRLDTRPTRSESAERTREGW